MIANVLAHGLHIIAVVVMATGSMASGDITYGSPVTVTHREVIAGDIREYSSFLSIWTKKRDLAIVVSPGASYRTFEAKNAQRWARGIDLMNGPAYVHIARVGGGATQLSALDEAAFIFSGPDRGVPALMAWVEKNNDDERATMAIRARLEEVADWILRQQQDGKQQFDLRVKGIDPAGLEDQRTLDLDSVLERLMTATSEQEQAQAGLELSLLSSVAMSDVYAFLTFPFIITRRTVGGAEGTEVVVYLQPDEHEPHAKAKAYYCYLRTSANPAPDVKVCGYMKGDSGDLFDKVGSIRPCTYLEVDLVYDGDWYIDKDAQGDPRVQSYTIDDAMNADLKSIIKTAHDDAVQAAVIGEQPYPCGIQ